MGDNTYIGGYNDVQYIQYKYNIDLTPYLWYNIDLTPYLWLLVFHSAMWMIAVALLLHGLIKRKPGFMMPWIVVVMITLLFSSICSILWLILSATLYGHPQNMLTRKQSQTVMAVSTVIIGLANALGYYIWDIVRSAYKQIKEENQTNQHAIPFQIPKMNTTTTTRPDYYTYEQKPGGLSYQV